MKMIMIFQMQIGFFFVVINWSLNNLLDDDDEDCILDVDDNDDNNER